MAVRTRGVVMFILGSLLVTAALGDGPTLDAPPAKPVSVTVILSNGDRLSGPVVSQDDVTITIDHPVLGRIALPKVPKPSPAPTVLISPPADAGVEDGEPSSPVLVTKVDLPTIAPVWTGKAGLSVNYTNNANTTLNARLSGQLNKKTKAEAFALQAWYLVETSNGEVTQSKAYVEAAQDWLIADSPWLHFLNTQYLYNSNQAWEHQLSPNAGWGYRFLNTDDYSLTGKFGGGFRWEYALNTVHPELFFRVDGRMNLTKTQSFNGFLQLTPAIDDFGNTQGILQLNYAMQMDFSPPMSLTFFIQDNFDTQPPAGSTSNDITAGIGVEYAF
jgi:putative salt-induced outer membrane protein YdiY